MGRYDRLDGSGRKPRGVQLDYFAWREQPNDVECDAAQLPVGSGKSFLAAAEQEADGASTITPSNILIDQYVDGYPGRNFMKGKVHYRCFSGLSCSDWIDVLEQEPCGECPYKKSRERACREPTFFNPLSLYYFRLIHKTKRFKTIVVDEAHQLSSLMLLLTAKRFRKSVYKFDERCSSEIYLAGWMREQIRKLDQLAQLYINTHNYKKASEIAQEMESISITLQCLEQDPQNYAIYFEDGLYRNRPEKFLNVRPIRPPRNIMRKLLACDKLVLLSGTLFPTDIEDLTAGRSHRFIDLPSPIPKEARLIRFNPTPFPINYQTNPKQLAEAIEKVLDQHPGLNTIIHTTYDRQKKMLPFFKRPLLVNTPETKNETLEKFKKEGGVFLAAGCAEGLDLKDDLCRLNIIPHLITPNLGDPVVKKRVALEDGQKWLGLETLKTTIQQAGRSTRHEKDFSTTICMDPRFPSLIKRFGKDCPKSFTEAIQWTS